MSHAEPGPLASYNSLQDPHLGGFFANTRIRKHLKKSGLVSKSGEIVSEKTYRLKMAKKEHKDHVRDLLATAIVHKALDMERSRQHDLRKRLDDMYKAELVKKVKSDRQKKGDEGVMSLLTPREKVRKRSRKHRPRTAPPQLLIPSQLGYDEDTGRLFYNVAPSDTSTGDELNSLISGSGYNPYYKPYPPATYPMPAPPPSRTPRQGSRSASATAGPKKNKIKLHRYTYLAHSEPAFAHKVQLQSMAEVTMRFLGPKLNLKTDMFAEERLCDVMVLQQHCGGSSLCVFRELLPPNTIFTFISRRHRGTPFGLTFYIDSMQDIRLSSCCEYKHKPGHILGGKNGHFQFVNVEGAAPCYRCQIAFSMKDKQKSRGDKRSREGKKNSSKQPSPRSEHQPADQHDKKKDDVTERFEVTITKVNAEDDDEDSAIMVDTTTQTPRDDDVAPSRDDDVTESNDSNDVEGEESTAVDKDDEGAESTKDSGIQHEEDADDDEIYGDEDFEDDDEGEESAGEENKEDFDKEMEAEAIKENKEESDVEMEARANEESADQVEAKTEEVGRESDVEDDVHSERGKSYREENEEGGDDEVEVQTDNVDEEIVDETEPETKAEEALGEEKLDEIYSEDKSSSSSESDSSSSDSEDTDIDDKFSPRSSDKDDSRRSSMKDDVDNISENDSVTSKSNEDTKKDPVDSSELPDLTVSRNDSEIKSTEETRESNNSSKSPAESVASVNSLVAESDLGSTKESVKDKSSDVEDTNSVKSAAGSDSEGAAKDAEHVTEVSDGLANNIENDADFSENGVPAVDQLRSLTEDSEEVAKSSDEVLKVSEHDSDKNGKASECEKETDRDNDSNFDTGKELDSSREVSDSVRDVSNPETDTDKNHDKDLDSNRKASDSDGKLLDSEKVSDRDSDSDEDSKRKKSKSGSDAGSRGDSGSEDRSRPESAGSAGILRSSSKTPDLSDDENKPRKTVSFNEEVRVYAGVAGDPEGEHDVRKSTTEDNSGRAVDQQGEQDTSVNTGSKEGIDMDKKEAPVEVIESQQVESEGSSSSKQEKEESLGNEFEVAAENMDNKMKIVGENMEVQRGSKQNGENSLDGVSKEMDDGEGGNSDEQNFDEKLSASAEISTVKEDDAIMESPEPSDSDTGSKQTESEKEVTDNDFDIDPGNDPDSVESEERISERALKAVGTKPGVKHEGSVKSLIEDQKDVEIASVALNPAQIEEVASLVESNSDVGSLSLRNVSLGNEGVKQLTSKLKNSTNVKMLNLNVNNIGTEGAVDVADTIKNNTTIKMLLLHGNPLGDQGVTSIIDAILENEATAVSTLDIGDCGLGDVGAMQIARLLESNTTITDLNISANQITRKGWREISEALKKNSTLRALSLDYSKITDEDLSVLANGFRESTSLRSVDLEANRIRDEGARVLLDVLRENERIIDMTLVPMNQIDDNILDEIKDILDHRIRSRPSSANSDLT